MVGFQSYSLHLLFFPNASTLVGMVLRSAPVQAFLCIVPFSHSISMWPFILTRSVTLQRKIQASKAEVLDIVQDPDEALRLSPLVFSVIRDDKDPAWYTVTERLPILGGFYESSTTFRCRWEKAEGGADVEVLAGAGTRLKSEMRVLDSEEGEGEVVFQEALVVKVSLCVAPLDVAFYSANSGPVFFDALHRIHHDKGSRCYARHRC